MIDIVLEKDFRIKYLEHTNRIHLVILKKSQMDDLGSIQYNEYLILIKDIDRMCRFTSHYTIKTFDTTTRITSDVVRVKYDDSGT